MTARAALWSRVSSRKQATSDREGLPYQRDMQTAALAHLQAQDSGIAWAVTHSGGSVHQTAEWAEMLARAGRDFDVLVVAYASRLGRNAEEVLRAVRLIGEAGASVYFAEERIDTADDGQWDAMAREIVESEAYRRRLSRTMTRTYESRWRRRGLPAGVPPFGFRADWTHDPERAPIVRDIFEQYARINISLRSLAEKHGIAEELAKVIVRNPAYKGEAQRHGETIPGAMEPIVDPTLWEKVRVKREARRIGGGGRTPAQPNMLAGGRLYCECGRRLRLDGYDGQGTHRLRHLKPLCASWGTSERKPTRYITDILKTALSTITPSEEMIQRLVEYAARSEPSQPKPDTRATRKALAHRFANGEISMADFTGQIAALDAQDTAAPQPAHEPITGEQFREYFAIFQNNPDWPDERGWAILADHVFNHYEYRGPDTLAVSLTPAAHAYYVPATLPERVLVGGEGLEPPTSSV